jgi:hypothetical protein
MDLDRYYTPPVIASELVAVGLSTAPAARVVADTACGAGNLLVAAEGLVAGSVCIGMDNDRNAIRRLRSRNPRWLLSVADVLDPRFASVRAVTMAPACDLLTLNPPFSMFAKSVSASFYGSKVRSSVAMAHVLRSLETFQPVGGAVAIVPESLLFSDIDAKARALVACRYEARILRGLRNSTFRGARANALLVQWTPRTEVENADDVASPPQVLIDPVVTRGGLPLFEARNKRRGLPLVHSTSIATIAKTGDFDHCVRVKGIGRGVVCGTLLFLPRVGVPSRKHCQIVRVESPVQLSDCVFALGFSSMRKALRFRRGMLGDWPSLVDRYRGTGARYISVAKMKEWVRAVAATHL